MKIVSHTKNPKKFNKKLSNHWNYFIVFPLFAGHSPRCVCPWGRLVWNEPCDPRSTFCPCPTSIWWWQPIDWMKQINHHWKADHKRKLKMYLLWMDECQHERWHRWPFHVECARCAQQICVCNIRGPFRFVVPCSDLGWPWPHRPCGSECCERCIFFAALCSTARSWSFVWCETGQWSDVVDSFVASR